MQELRTFIKSEGAKNVKTIINNKIPEKNEKGIFNFWLFLVCFFLAMQTIKKNDNNDIVQEDSIAIINDSL